MLIEKERNIKYTTRQRRAKSEGLEAINQMKHEKERR